MPAEPIEELREIFPELRALCGFQSLREIIEAAHGVKVSRLTISERKIGALVALLERLGLRIALHDHKYILSEDAGKGGWISGYGLEVALEEPHEGYIHIYTGRDPEAVRAAMKAEHAVKIEEFGRLLGYPSCCREFYLRNLELAERAQGDFLLQLLISSMRVKSDSMPFFPFLTNIAAQYFQAGLLSFYPCSFFCTEALRIARRALALLSLYDRELAAEIVATALSPIVYTEYEGIYRLLNARQCKDTVHYRGVEKTLDGALAALLATGTRIQIHAHNEVSIFNGDERVARLAHPTLGMMVFGGQPDGL